MADTAKRLVGPTALTATAADMYTVPAATTAILRHIQVANEDGATAYLFTFSIGVDAAGKRLYRAVPIPAGGVLDWTGFTVLAAGEKLQAYADTANKLTLTVSGVEVS